MVIYGTRATGIGSFEIGGTKCIHCEEAAPHDVQVFGRYAHVFWIPLFPLGRVAVAECTACKKTIKKKEFSAPLRQQYDKVKSAVKRPIWHWSGLMLIGLFSLLIGGISAFSTSDPRTQLLEADLEAMTLQPTMAVDSNAFFLKQMFDESINEELEPESFEYLTKVKDNKVLILVKIPELKHLEKSERPGLLDVLKGFAMLQPDFQGKDAYIGVHGKYNMMLIKTPTDEDNSRMAIESPLYEFYGEKEAFLTE